MIKLDPNADCPNVQYLAEDLPKRIAAYKREHAYNEGNPNWQLYLKGVISAYESVLDAIGYTEEEEI